MVSSFHETQSKRKNKRGLPDHLWVLQRALEGRSGRTERSKGAQGRILHQRPENRGALNKPTNKRRSSQDYCGASCWTPCDRTHFQNVCNLVRVIACSEENREAWLVLSSGM